MRKVCTFSAHTGVRAWKHAELRPRHCPSNNSASLSGHDVAFPIHVVSTFDIATLGCSLFFALALVGCGFDFVWPADPSEFACRDSVVMFGRSCVRSRRNSPDVPHVST